MVYELSVFRPLAVGGHRVDVFDIEVDQPIEWVKAHADEIAAKAARGAAYNALNVAQKDLP